jgi:hypothetical protein
MRISDTLDQLLRSLLVTSSIDPLGAAGANVPRSGALPPAVAPADRAAPLAIDVETAAAEVAINRAHELNGPELGVTPVDATVPAQAKRDPEELASLEASAGAIENLGLGFHLGAAIERIAVAANQGSEGRVSLREAVWLIERYISLLELRPVGADLHASSLRLARTGETIAGLHEMKAKLASVLEPVAPSPTGPSTEGASEPEPHPEPEPVETGTVVAVADAVVAVADAAESPEPPQVVNELPSIKRELFVTTVRAGIAVVAVVAIVLVLTLIAQWH